MNHAIEAIKKFNEERDWNQFHSPVNLAKSIIIEAAELLECFQWDDQRYDKERVIEELADVLNYCVLLSLKLNVDIEDILLKKLEKNRVKYPVDKARGKCTKYDRL